MTAKEIVFAHLRACEDGNWDKALSYISDNYSVVGVIPFPINVFVKLEKKDALTMHKKRKIALPDFRFNEVYEIDEPEHVRVRVNLTGTHTGVIDYTGAIRGIPIIMPTNKYVVLNPEWFDYYTHDGLITKVVANIPGNAGVKGLVKAVTDEVE